MEQVVNKGRFRRGQEPWNKGTVGLMKPNRGSFQLGRDNGKTLPLGTIRQRRFRGVVRRHIKVGKSYKFPSMAPLGWMDYCKYLWIENYGRLLRGDVVHHMNGDALDDRIENLLAVPRSVHPTLHNKHWLIQPSGAIKKVCLARYKREEVMFDAAE